MVVVVELDTWLDFQEVAKRAEFRLYKLYKHSDWPPTVELYAVTPWYIIKYSASPYDVDRKKVGTVKVRRHFGVHEEELELRSYKYMFGYGGEWLHFGGEIHELVEEEDREKVRKSWDEFTDGLCRHLRGMGFMPGEAWSGEIGEVYSE